MGEGAVVVFGKPQGTLVSQYVKRRPVRRVKVREVVFQVVGENQLEAGGGIRLMLKDALQQAGNLVRVAMADDGEGDEGGHLAQNG